jgi:hypothetical protein
MGKKKKRGRPRIGTAAYWREYYRQKQREWRAAHRYSRLDAAEIRAFDEAVNVIDTHEHAGEFKEW